MALPGATIDGLPTATPTPSQRASTALEPAAASPWGTFGPGGITKAMNVRVPVPPVYATEHTVDWVHAPTSTLPVMSKISTAHGVPVMLMFDRASSSAVEPAARILLSAESVTVGLLGFSRGAPSAMPGIGSGGASEHAPGAARAGLLGSAGHAVAPAGSTGVPACEAAAARPHEAPGPEFGHCEEPLGTSIRSTCLLLDRKSV